MKTPASRIGIGLSLCLALLVAFSNTNAQTPVGPPQIAPLRVGLSGPTPQGKGFVPPRVDLSHLTGQTMPKDARSEAVPSSFDWRTQGKVTSVKNQGACGSCYAFAAIGNIESKLLIDSAGTSDFSENNAKECNWYEVTGTGGGTSCSGGNYDLLADWFSKKGTVLESCDPYVASDVNCKTTCAYQKTLLDWRIICGNTVPDASVLKQYIYDHGPVYTSFYAGDGDAWDSEFNRYDGSYTLYYTGLGTPNHAVLIVGWDDSLSHAGGLGAWIVKNSWGTNWGGKCGYGSERGYFTIAYGSASIGKYSSFIHAWQDYDASENLLYYDESGWSSSMGYYGQTTAWGLDKFIPASNGSVRRVEFWTTDATTDLDVYLYDSFNGTTLGTLLWQSLNNSFGEAGYHSVAVSPSVPLTAGDDIVAVVKFTNASYTFPLAIDYDGPVETQRTYISSSGANGTWSQASHDIAIRLRTGSALAPEPDVSIVKRVIGSGFAPGDPITFTLTISNGGSAVAAHPVVTDILPAQVLSPTVASTLAATPTGALNYVWDIAPLDPGASGVITIYGQVDPGLPGDFSFANRATISDPDDATPGNNSSTAFVGESKLYLPSVIKRFPPIPYVPTLYAISNPDGDGNYTVSWSSADLADTYTLQEDDNADFSSPTAVYGGSGTSWGASGKPSGTYYYRVQASNSWGDSGWSTIQSVTVQGGWSIILSENFEGTFPGPWNVSDNNGANYGEYYWGKRTCRPYAGSYSGWGVGGGTNGGALACGSYYPNKAYSWMIYGPFSLVGATAGDLSFELWLNSESGYDWMCRMASVDGTHFYGTCSSGSTSGWTSKVLDLKNVYTLGNLMGQPQVWVALIFSSDNTINYPEGPYVDNVVLRKCTYPTCPGMSNVVPASGNSEIVEAPAALKLTR